MDPLNIKLSDDQLAMLAGQIFQMLNPSNDRQPDGLKNWIRAEFLYEQKIFSKTTLNKFYKEGLIGKSTIGGMAFFKVSDIEALLERHHVKKEHVQRIGRTLRREAA